MQLMMLGIAMSLPLWALGALKLVDDNIDLYRPDRNSYMASLERAKTLEVRSDAPLVFHCFWRVPREFTVKQLTVLKSIIVSHQEDFERLEINLWSNVDLSENPLFQEVSSIVNLRPWNYSEEVKGTLLENVGSLDEEAIYDDLCYLEGDLFRLLILHKYGGFYVDMDVLVLRNMSPLNHLEFTYQWGTSGFEKDKPNIEMNGAVMRLNKGSPLSTEFLEKVVWTPITKNSFNLGTKLYSKVKKNDIWVLPGIWFDSEWGFEGTWGEKGGISRPFQTGDFLLFEGAFAWHWHNRWDEPIEEGSKFHFLQTQIDRQFEQFNLYKQSDVDGH